MFPFDAVVLFFSYTYEAWMNSYLTIRGVTRATQEVLQGQKEKLSDQENRISRENS
jgi:hypothetical protein